MASLPPASLQPGGATSTSLHPHTSCVTCRVSRVTCHEAHLRLSWRMRPPAATVASPSPAISRQHSRRAEVTQARCLNTGTWCRVYRGTGEEEVVVLTWCPCWGGVWGTEWTQQWTVDSKSSPSSRWLCWAAVCMSLHQHISHTAAGIYTGIATLTLRSVLIHHKGKVTSTYSYTIYEI